MLNYNHNKISKEYKDNNPTTQGISDIDKCCYILQSYFGLEDNLLGVYWPKFKDFHKLRKDIEHRYNHGYVTIDTKMIKNNLDYALRLLKHIELVTREKRIN